MGRALLLRLPFPLLRMHADLGQCSLGMQQSRADTALTSSLSAFPPCAGVSLSRPTSRQNPSLEATYLGEDFPKGIISSFALVVELSAPVCSCLNSSGHHTAFSIMLEFYDYFYVRTLEDERLTLAHIQKDTTVRDLKKEVARRTGNAAGWGSMELLFAGEELNNGDPPSIPSLKAWLIWSQDHTLKDCGIRDVRIALRLEFWLKLTLTLLGIYHSLHPVPPHAPTGV